jgi:hypothetical protein
MGLAKQLQLSYEKSTNVMIAIVQRRAALAEA